MRDFGKRWLKIPFLSMTYRETRFKGRTEIAAKILHSGSFWRKGRHGSTMFPEGSIRGNTINTAFFRDIDKSYLEIGVRVAFNIMSDDENSR